MALDRRVVPAAAKPGETARMPAMAISPALSISGLTARLNRDPALCYSSCCCCCRDCIRALGATDDARRSTEGARLRERDADNGLPLMMYGFVVAW